MDKLTTRQSEVLEIIWNRGYSTSLELSDLGIMTNTLKSLIARKLIALVYSERYMIHEYVCTLKGGDWLESNGFIFAEVQS